MDYLELLEHSFEMERADTGCGCHPETRLAYLSENIFDFTTYDSEKDEFFGRKAVEVCAAINDGKTFDFIKDADNYTWFLVMCNMPFFAERLEWGTSIRGAWWAGRPGEPIKFDSCGLWMGDEQLIDTLKFSADEWKRFIWAVIEFAHGEMKPNADVNVRPQFPTKTRDVIWAPHAQFVSWCQGEHASEYGDVLAAAAVCREDALLAYLGAALARLPIKGEDDCITQAREFMAKMMGPNGEVRGGPSGPSERAPG